MWLLAFKYVSGDNLYYHLAEYSLEVKKEILKEFSLKKKFPTKELTMTVRCMSVW